jgi:hypothetical protein
LTSANYVATPGALAALEKSGQSPMDFLSRHVTGDWGEIPEEDRKENQFSLEKGFRLMSSYRTTATNRTHRESSPRSNLSQSEHDWAFAKRAPARGDDPEAVIRQIARYRNSDKSDPEGYARLTVTKAQAETKAGTICAFFLGQRAAGRVAAASVGECERGRSLRRINDQTCSIPRGPFVRASRGLVCAVP